MLKIKVCGLKEPENIRDVIDLRPAFIGFIFHKDSKRNFELEEAPIAENESTKKCGVFVNKNLAFILEKVEIYQLQAVQLHGNEKPELCKTLKKFKLIVLKSFNIDEAFNFDEIAKYEASVDYFLFDAKGSKPGGNGHHFNWEVLRNYKLNTRFFLSGGISLNDADKIKSLDHKKLIGIDVNSGFENEPGLKNIDKLKEFKNEFEH